LTTHAVTVLPVRTTAEKTYSCTHPYSTATRTSSLRASKSNSRSWRATEEERSFAARLIDEPEPAPPASETEHGQNDDQMCDVLPPTEFGQELTELLLNNAESLTGRQILEVRQSVLERAQKHGWVDI
jgi:hypothetical protein